MISEPSGAFFAELRGEICWLKEKRKNPQRRTDAHVEVFEGRLDVFERTSLVSGDSLLLATGALAGAFRASGGGLMRRSLLRNQSGNQAAQDEHLGGRRFASVSFRLSVHNPTSLL
jgi:hypothetical protein